jgi:hypothetical protein
MFDISKEFKEYGFLRHYVPLNKLTIFYSDLIMFNLQTNGNKKSIPAYYINILVVMSFETWLCSFNKWCCGTDKYGAVFIV